MNAIHKILSPTDFSSASAVGVDAAVALASRLGASVELVHVIQPPIYVGWEDSPAGLAASAQVLEQAREHAKQQLEAEAAKYAGKGIQIRTQLLEGSAHQQIASMSKDYDLVVMSTHGRTGLPHLFLGSVAERVVRAAHSPVMTVPAHPRA